MVVAVSSDLSSDLGRVEFAIFAGQLVPGLMLLRKPAVRAARRLRMILVFGTARGRLRSGPRGELAGRGVRGVPGGLRSLLVR